jgi:hypothetical protein
MNPKWLPLFILAYSVFVLAPVVSPPILNEPILLFSVDPVKVDGFGICGVNIADIGAIKGGAMGGQKGYRRGAPEGTRPSETHSAWGLRMEIIFWH